MNLNLRKISYQRMTFPRNAASSLKSLVTFGKMWLWSVIHKIFPALSMIIDISNLFLKACPSRFWNWNRSLEIIPKLTTLQFQRSWLRKKHGSGAVSTLLVVRYFLNTFSAQFQNNFNVLTVILIFIARRGYDVFKRLYSVTEQSFPKLTTHYSIVPRETDPRWEGITQLLLCYITKLVIFIWWVMQVWTWNGQWTKWM